MLDILIGMAAIFSDDPDIQRTLAEGIGAALAAAGVSALWVGRIVALAANLIPVFATKLIVEKAGRAKRAQARSLIVKHGEFVENIIEAVMQSLPKSARHIPLLRRIMKRAAKKSADSVIEGKAPKIRAVRKAIKKGSITAGLVGNSEINAATGEIRHSVPIDRRD